MFYQFIPVNKIFYYFSSLSMIFVNFVKALFFSHYFHRYDISMSSMYVLCPEMHRSNRIPWRTVEAEFMHNIARAGAWLPARQRSTPLAPQQAHRQCNHRETDRSPSTSNHRFVSYLHRALSEPQYVVPFSHFPTSMHIVRSQRTSKGLKKSKCLVFSPPTGGA